jgi:hypothetical protein
VRAAARVPLSSVLALALAAGGACASSGERTCVDAPFPRPPTAQEDVGRLVGELLSADARASRAAERTLVALDPEGRAALAALARDLPDERDPRWFHVLDRNALFSAASDDDRLDLLLWRASREDDAETASRARDALAQEARRAPGLLAARLDRDAADRAALARALGEARAREAVPALLALYRGARTPAERRAASAALGAVAGDSLRPRAEGTDAEREEDAKRVEEWHARGGSRE